MRLYSFTNHYLSSLQHGLQTAHVVGALFPKYPRDEDENSCADQLYTWAYNNRTIIIKNGGNHEQLQDIANLFCENVNPYPWVEFREDYVSLNGTITAVGIVIPQKFYADDWALQTFTPWEQELLDLIQRTPLAI